MKARSKGFTLVELLVVIGIIALLVSILLPSLARARESAKRVTCASQLRQIVLATQSYAADNKGTLPPMNLDDGTPTYDCSMNNAPTAPAVGPTIARSISFVLWGVVGGTNTATSYAKAGCEESGFNSLTSQVPQIGSNIGRLAARGYLKGDIRKTATCPASEPIQDLNYAGDYTRYLFDIHWVAREYPKGSGKYYVSPVKKLTQYKAPKGQFAAYGVGGSTAAAGLQTNPNFMDYEWALAADPVTVPYDGSVQQNRASTHHMGRARAVNLAYIDGSVRTSVVGDNWGRTTSNRYGPILDLVGWAESVSEGKTQHAANTNYVLLPIMP